MLPRDPHHALAEHFGFPDFRPGQEEAVAAALAGRDLLVIMPTGAGKSLCYQLPALIDHRVTVVVSPLVSLMEDQVAVLARRAPERVAVLNAQRSPAENEAALGAVADGVARIVYLAPERLAAPRVVEVLRAAGVGLFVVDEAHCVSAWGHDFRPDYFRLADAAQRVGARSTLALTATATPAVAQDVVERLALRDPVRVATGFDRPALAWAVEPVRSRDRLDRAAALLAPAAARPAIVYAGTRRQVDQLAVGLAERLGRPVVGYHAGLAATRRAAAQEAFLGGEVDVVVATNAFGMGVDKADVRTVIHAGVPPSVEAYYQEAGRAGRDGRPARAVLLSDPGDKGLHGHFISRAEVADTAPASVVAALVAAGGADGGYDLGLAELTRLVARPEACADGALSTPAPADGAWRSDAVTTVLGVLTQAGVLEQVPARTGRLCGSVLRPFDAAAQAACAGLIAQARRARWQQYRSIWQYVEGRGCRRAAIVAYFGDAAPVAGRPGCCDVCDRRAAPRHGLRAAPAPAATQLEAAVMALAERRGEDLGPERAVAVLRGSRARELAREGLDGLPEYGAFADVPAGVVAATIARLRAAGRLSGDRTRLTVGIAHAADGVRAA